MTDGPQPLLPTLTARRLGLLSQHDAIVLMREDSPVCRSEGHGPRSQVLLMAHGREVMATLYQVTRGELVQTNEAGLSEAAWERLGVADGDEIHVRHPPALTSMSSVRRRVYGMRRVVEQEGGCLAWGGAMRLSPADDVLIRVERVLDIDTEGQLVASVLSKKIAAGSTHVVLDIPVGPTAKVRSDDDADAIADALTHVARVCGVEVRCVRTDGGQPVGRGIGPALEARDVLAVLRGETSAPSDLRRRACLLAGAALELAGRCGLGEGMRLAEQTLTDGRAWAKFQRICEAQGGLREPPRSVVNRPLLAQRSGRVMAMNNRTLARLAKLAGAPDDKAAGVELHVRLGDEVAAGEPLMTVHAEAPGELAYALDYAAANPDMLSIEA